LGNTPYALHRWGWDMKAYTFAIGGSGYGMPVFASGSGDFRSEATVNFGPIVVVTGFIGTLSAAGWATLRQESRSVFMAIAMPSSCRAFVWLGPSDHHSKYRYTAYMVTAPTISPIHRPDQCRHYQSESVRASARPRLH